MGFAAAQAAEKIAGMPDDMNKKFAAAQAAEKLIGYIEVHINSFAAAQAAEKFQARTQGLK